jgi:Flp pilus assembly pilin Flp
MGLKNRRRIRMRYKRCLHRSSGQSLVEFTILLAALTVVAVSGWRTLRPAIGSLYTNVAAHRADLDGMLP